MRLINTWARARCSRVPPSEKVYLGGEGEPEPRPSRRVDANPTEVGQAICGQFVGGSKPTPPAGGRMFMAVGTDSCRINEIEVQMQKTCFRSPKHVLIRSLLHGH